MLGSVEASALHARAAADARGLRGRPRRRPARARRPAILQRRRLGRHAVVGRAAGRCSTRRARNRWRLHSRLLSGRRARASRIPAAQITERPEDAAAKWKEMPPLTAVNVVPVSDLKPGATRAADGRRPERPRAGGARVSALRPRQGAGAARAGHVAVADARQRWRWRTRPTTISGSGCTRWLVDGVPDRVMVSSTPDRVQRGEPVTLTADVVDAEYRGVNDGRITAHATAPSGTRRGRADGVDRRARRRVSRPVHARRRTGSTGSPSTG